MSNKGSITVIGAAAMGVGSMVGAGIFALLGQAGAIAGNATYISFLIGGLVALSSGYSYAKLGVKFPSSGGVMEFLLQGFGKGTFASTFSILFICSGIITMGMVSKTFGTYAASMVGNEHLVPVFTSGIIILFVALNFIGSEMVSKAETLIVIVKLVILASFTCAGMFYVNWEHFNPANFPSSSTVLGSLAITYFAYTGFAVITNTAGSMSNPSKQLPRAIYLAIGFTIILYIGLTLVTFGNLSVSDVIKYKETALAEAAKPIFGSLGFVIISFAALLSTSSSLNANLFSNFQMANEESNEGDLSREFAAHLWKNGTKGLLFLGVTVLLLANFVDLTSIASIGSTATLLVTLTVHIGHFRIRKKTGVSTLGLILAILANAACIILFINATLKAGNYTVFLSLISLVVGCFIFERFKHSKLSV